MISHGPYILKSSAFHFLEASGPEVSISRQKYRCTEVFDSSSFMISLALVDFMQISLSWFWFCPPFFLEARASLPDPRNKSCPLQGSLGFRASNTSECGGWDTHESSLYPPVLPFGVSDAVAATSPAPSVQQLLAPIARSVWSSDGLFSSAALATKLHHVHTFWQSLVLCL